MSCNVTIASLLIMSMICGAVACGDETTTVRVPTPPIFVAATLVQPAGLPPGLAATDRIRNSIVAVGLHSIDGICKEGATQRFWQADEKFAGPYGSMGRIIVASDLSKLYLLDSQYTFDCANQTFAKWRQAPAHLGENTPCTVDEGRQRVLCFSGRRRPIGFYEFDLKTKSWRGPIESEFDVKGLAYHKDRGVLAVISMPSGNFSRLEAVWLNDDLSPKREQVPLEETDTTFLDSQPELLCVDNYLIVREHRVPEELVVFDLATGKRVFKGSNDRNLGHEQDAFGDSPTVKISQLDALPTRPYQEVSIELQNGFPMPLRSLSRRFRRSLAEGELVKEEGEAIRNYWGLSETDVQQIFTTIVRLNLRELPHDNECES